ncbi:MAG: hypothetical protein Q9O62_12295 [Ardenticatenia bacterium]|nr:hypothetical protein [Ardenticatenia bacterium]
MSDLTDADLRRLMQEAYGHVAPSGRVYRALCDALLAPSPAGTLPRARAGEAVRFVPLVAIMVVASVVLFFMPRTHRHVALLYPPAPPAPVGIVTATDPQLDTSAPGFWTPLRFVADLR